MIDTKKLLEVMEEKSSSYKLAIEELKSKKASTASKQCMKTYTDFDILALRACLGDEDSKNNLIKRLDAKYNKVIWISISKQEYIKLLREDFDESSLKMEKGNFFKKQ